jgi:hypothetical protein
MAFPASPLNNQTAIIGNVTYRFNSTFQTWTRIPSTSLAVQSLLASQANVVSGTTRDFSATYANITYPFATAGYFWSNGSVYAGLPFGSTAQVQFNDDGAFGGNAGLTFDKVSGNLAVGGNIAITGNIIPGANAVYTLGTNAFRFEDLYLGNSITIGNAIITGTDSTITFTNSVGVPLSIDSNVNTIGNVVSGNLSITSNTQSTNTSSGAVLIQGGAGLTGNLYISGSGGNAIVTNNSIYAGNIVNSGRVITSGGVFWPNLAPYGINPTTTLTSTITMYQAGAPTVYTGTARWYAPYDISIIKITPRLATASDGNIFMDVRKNSSITIANLSIYPAQTTGNVFETPTTINSGQYLTINVNAIGNTGSDLYVQIIYIAL